MGEVPVLVARRRALTQSGVILDYLAEKTGKFGWRNDAERREVLRWLLFDNHKLTSYTATLPLPAHLHQGRRDAVTELLRQRMTAALSCCRTISPTTTGSPATA